MSPLLQRFVDEARGHAGTPHDSVFRRIFGVPENMASQLRAVLPPGLAGRLDLDQLELTATPPDLPNSSHGGGRGAVRGVHVAGRSSRAGSGGRYPRWWSRA